LVICDRRAANVAGSEDPAYNRIAGRLFGAADGEITNYQITKSPNHQITRSPMKIVVYSGAH